MARWNKERPVGILCKNETFRINEAWDWCENILIVKIHNKRLNKVEACKIVCTCLWFTDQYFISDLKVVVVRSCTKCYIFLCVAFCRNNGLMNWWILYVLWKKKYKKSWKKKISKIIFLAIQLHDQWYDMKVKRYNLISFIDSRNFRIFSYHLACMILYFYIYFWIYVYHPSSVPFKHRDGLHVK